jgi:hypothetical protein
MQSWQQTLHEVGAVPPKGVRHEVGLISYYGANATSTRLAVGSTRYFWGSSL